MRNNRLQLVVLENSAQVTTDATTEPAARAATTDSVTSALRFVYAGEGAPPDDAA
jgi:hypothetical protein